MGRKPQKLKNRKQFWFLFPKAVFILFNSICVCVILLHFFHPRVSMCCQVSVSQNTKLYYIIAQLSSTIRYTYLHTTYILKIYFLRSFRHKLTPSIFSDNFYLLLVTQTVSMEEKVVQWALYKTDKLFLYIKSWENICYNDNCVAKQNLQLIRPQMNFQFSSFPLEIST